MIPRQTISIKSLARLGFLASAGLILFLLESIAPRPLPWIKLGLGNLPVVMALEMFGGLPAMAVSLVKVCGASLISGGFASPTFVIGGVSSLVSVSAMSISRWSAPRCFSVVGISVLGAVTHQLSQLVVAFLYLQNEGLFSFAPLFMLTGLVTGFAIGLIAHFCLARLRLLARS